MVEDYDALVFEAHSTDYQTPQARHLVKDHFAILKVGPALTFALREALFSLAAIEEELLPAKACSGLRQVLENVMLDRPEYWQNHYHGDGHARRLARGYSYSDRVRYYWPDRQIDEAFARLVRNLADWRSRAAPQSVYAAAVPQSSRGRSQGGTARTHPRSHSGHTAAVPRRLCGRYVP